MDDDLEPPGTPVLVIVVVGVLAVIGALTVVRWVFNAVFGLVTLAVIVGLVVVAFLAVRAIKRR